jgi:hypothetical protein
VSAVLPYPLQEPSSSSTEYQAIAFVVNSILAHVRTAHPVEVIAIAGGGVGPIGTVDVKPLVNQIDGIGEGEPHGVVYGRPYIRYQGGTSAVILDPVVGDTGLLVCCDRDTSNVIATLAAALPGSLRRFNFADGVYVGCHLSKTTPTDYVWIKPASAGIVMRSAGTITIQGSQINITGPVNANGATISNSGEVTDAAGKVLGTHEHLPGTYVAPSGGGPITGDSGAPV